MLKNGCVILPDPQKSVEICDFIAQTAKELSKNHRVFIIKESDPVALSELAGRLFMKHQSELPDNSNTYRVIRPVFLLPLTRFKYVTNANYVLFYLFFQFHLLLSNFFQSKKIVFWFFFPHTYRYIFPQFWVHFDCVDIHPENSHVPKKNGKAHQLLRRANSITCIAKSQKQLLQTLTDKVIHLVPQGFELPKFRPSLKTRSFQRRTKPVIGFVGALSDRIDYELLQKLISHSPQWIFEFWGPIQVFFTNQEIIQKQIERLQDYENVLIMGNIPRNDLYKKMMHFDVGIIPYKMNSILNRYCYPMKLFEYFYCGIPVVATPIKELKSFHNLVIVGSSATEWRNAITSIISKPWSKENQDQQLVCCRENTWQSKIDSISSIICN